MKRKLLITSLLSLCLCGAISLARDNQKGVSDDFWTIYDSDQPDRAAALGEALYGDLCTGPFEISEIGDTRDIDYTLEDNTIYVLHTDTMEISSTIQMGNCTALVSRSGTTLTASAGFGNMVEITAKTGSILDGISLDGTNGNGNGIYMYDSHYAKVSNDEIFNTTNEGILVGQSSDINIINIENHNNGLSEELDGMYIYESQNIFLNDIKSYNNGFDGIYIESSNNITIKNGFFYSNKWAGIEYYDSNFSTFNGIKSYNNTTDGIYINGTDNILNNFVLYNNNGNGMEIEGGGRNSINNLVVFNNGGTQKQCGILMYNTSNSNIFNNTFVYNNHNGYCFNQGGNNNIFNNVTYMNNNFVELFSGKPKDNKYYGTMRLLGNINESFSAISAGTGSDIFQDGSIQTGNFSWSYILNPYSEELSLFDWDGSVYSTMRGPIFYYQKQVTTGYSYGVDMPTMSSVYVRSGDEIVIDESFEVDEDIYIGSDVHKVSGTIYTNKVNTIRSGESEILSGYLTNTGASDPLNIVGHIYSGDYMFHGGVTLDTSAPTCTPSQTAGDWTTGDVEISISCDDPDTVITSEGGASHIFTSNGSFTFQFQDFLGNTGTLTSTVSWIDRDAPVCEISYSTETITTGDVVASLTCNETVFGTTEYTFTGNGSYTLQVQDRLGNASSFTATVTWIDKSAPDCHIKYIPSTPTNGNVFAKLTGCDENIEEGLTVYEFTGNGSFTFEFSDSLGNIGSLTAEVDWIDREAPTCEIEYSPNTPTRENVVAMLTGCNEAVTGDISHVFTGNDIFTLIYQDLAGNSNSIQATVTGIDKTAPNCGIELIPSTPTNGNVTARLTGCDKSTFGTTSRQITENGTFTLSGFRDSLGNTGEIQVEVDWIDKTAPNCNIELIPSTPTNGNVIARLTGCDEPVTGNIQQEFSGNGTFTLSGFKDTLGNTGEITFDINLIDRTKPEITGFTAISGSTEKTPSIEFISTKAGKLEISGNGSTTKIDIQSGKNTLSLDQLGEGTYSGLTMKVIDKVGNVSEEIELPEFTIQAPKTNGDSKNAGGAGGGGGSNLSKDYCPDGDHSDSYYDGICEKDTENQTHGSAEATSGEKDNTISSGNTKSKSGFTDEMVGAYEYAYTNGITTKDSIESADMKGQLTRIAMAKMLANYSMNVLGNKPANVVVPDFTDISEKLNSDYGYSIDNAYQLGIMGINMPDNKFRPYDKVTRAEFVTALSRMLYNTLDGEDVYYSTHMKLMKEKGVITNTDPKLIELRRYVMLMLKRTGETIK